MLDVMATPASYLILAVTIVVSLVGFNKPRIVDALLFSTSGVLRRREYWRIATSGLVHADGVHLFFNMFALFFFGPAVEAMKGTSAFLILYGVCLVAGSALSLLEHLRSANYSALGASGAISGVVVAYAVFRPLDQISVFFIPMPAILFAVLYIVYSWVSVGRRDGIGHEAHLGGALAGLVLVCLMWPYEIREMIDDLRISF